MHEITQPDIPRLDFEDPLAWSKALRLRIEWIRHVAPQLDLDPGKLILAEVINSITGDDRVEFIIFNPEKADCNQNLYLERVCCEIETPETPESIRENLIIIKNISQSINWSIETNYNLIKEMFMDLKKKAKKHSEKDPELIEALKYHDLHKSTLDKLWHEFIRPPE